MMKNITLTALAISLATLSFQCNASLVGTPELAPAEQQAAPYATVTSYKEVVYAALETAAQDTPGSVIFVTDLDCCAFYARAGDKSIDYGEAFGSLHHRLTEKETDGLLRDPEIPRYLEALKAADVPTIALTSRPPIQDITIGKLSNKPDWLSLPFKDREALKEALFAQCTPEELTAYAVVKSAGLERDSGLKFSGQANFDNSFSVPGLTYANGVGYASGYDKGTAFLQLFKELKLEGVKHFFFIDDDPRTFKKITPKVVQALKDNGITAHLYQFPWVA